MTGSKYQSYIESTSITGSNAPYIEAYYEQFLEDPNSVSEDWRAYFRLIQDQSRPREQAHSEVVARFEKLAKSPATRSWAGAVISPAAVEKQAAVLRLMNTSGVRGHQAARVCPQTVAAAAFMWVLGMAQRDRFDPDRDNT